MEYKLGLTIEQRWAFRRLQVRIFEIAMRNDATELMAQQKVIESWIRGQMDIAVIRATSMVGTVPVMKMAIVQGGGSLSSERTIELRTLQAQACELAELLDIDNWRLKQLEIEEWISLQIDDAVVKACQHLITDVKGRLQ